MAFWRDCNNDRPGVAHWYPQNPDADGTWKPSSVRESATVEVRFPGWVLGTARFCYMIGKWVNPGCGYTPQRVCQPQPTQWRHLRAQV